MSVSVRIPTILRTYTGGESEVSAEGGTLAEVLDHLGGTAEAVATSRSVSELAAGLGVPMAVVEQVTAVLHRGMHPGRAAEHLLSQPVRPEGL